MVCLVVLYVCVCEGGRTKMCGGAAVRVCEGGV